MLTFKEKTNIAELLFTLDFDEVMPDTHGFHKYKGTVRDYVNTKEGMLFINDHVNNLIPYLKNEEKCKKFMNKWYKQVESITNYETKQRFTFTLNALLPKLIKTKC